MWTHASSILTTLTINSLPDTRRAKRGRHAKGRNYERIKETKMKIRMRRRRKKKRKREMKKAKSPMTTLQVTNKTSLLILLISLTDVLIGRDNEEKRG